MKALLKYIPIQFVLGFFLPKTMAAFAVWKAAKSPANTLALGEAGANEILALIDPALEAKVEEYEHQAAPLLTTVFSAIDEPNAHNVEVATTEAVTLGATLLKSKADPVKIQAALANVFDVINAEIA